MTPAPRSGGPDGEAALREQLARLAERLADLEQHVLELTDTMAHDITNRLRRLERPDTQLDSQTLARRRARILAVAHLRGLAYCRALRLKTREEWQNPDGEAARRNGGPCPADYTQAYRDRRWRPYIHREKSNAVAWRKKNGRAPRKPISSRARPLSELSAREQK